MKGKKYDWRWIWIEKFIPTIPISYFLLSYILFIIILSIYMFFDENVDWMDLSDCYQFLAAFFTSLLIPFEIFAIKLMLDGARGRFGLLCSYLSDSQARLRDPTSPQVFGKKNNYLTILLFIGLPLFLCKFDGFPYYSNNKDNINFLGLDIYEILLLFISICLLCLLCWIFINIHLTFGIMSKKLVIDAQEYNIAILRRKIMPVRNYFLIILMILMIGFSIFNASIIAEPMDDTEPIGGENIYNVQANLSLILMGILLITGIVLTLNSLINAQSIIDNAVDHQMDQIDRKIRKSSMEMNELLERKSIKDNERYENLQKILELQQKEWERITQEKTGLNLKEIVKEAGAFIASILIPVISFLIS